LGGGPSTSPLAVWISHQMLRTPLRASLAFGVRTVPLRFNESLRSGPDRVKRFREIHHKFTELLTFPLPSQIDPDSSTAEVQWWAETRRTILMWPKLDVLFWDARCLRAVQGVLTGAPDGCAGWPRSEIDVVLSRRPTERRTAEPDRL